jgi:aldose 1-epimerase
MARPRHRQDDPAATTIAAGDLQARFLPGFGMLGVSLRHKGVEILRRLDDLETAAAKGSTAGIPFLYPWANRLAAALYKKAGPEVVLDPASPLLHFDANGLPMHGVPWSRLVWNIIEARPSSFSASLDWSRPNLLAVFPYRHRLTMTASLQADSLTIATTVHAGDGPVPVSFGFHPYFGIPGQPRSQWRLSLPAMRRLVLDQRGIPTGAEEAFDGLDSPLGAQDFDDGYALVKDRATFCIAGAGRRIGVELLEGFTHAQVFTPKDKDYIAIEPMTAPANALISGDGLRLVVPDGAFRAVFRISIGRDPRLHRRAKCAEQRSLPGQQASAG